MKIGIRAHDFGKLEKEELAINIHKEGFKNIQLVLNKAFNDESGEAGTINSIKAKEIKDILNSYDIRVAMLGAYFNPVHSNGTLKEKAIAKFKEHLKYAKDFGTELVGTETGSYNDDEWTYNPKNHTDEALEEVIEIFTDLAKEAKQHDVYVAIEPVFNHVISTPKKMKYALDKINSENVKVIVDLLNLIQIESKENYKDVLEECIELFGDKIAIFHFKNFEVIENKVEIASLEDGYFDYNYILGKIKNNCPNACCIFEDLTGDLISSSKNYIEKI